MECYHVVTEHPLRVGDCICFDEAHHSGVYARVMSLHSEVQELLAHPEQHDGIPLSHELSVALREMAMERVRQAEFPQYPSRMACLYVSQTLKEAKDWADYFIRIGRPTYAIVRMETDGRCFTGDACNCFDGTADNAWNESCARHYWQNLPNVDGGRPIHEMLVDGLIRVVEMVEELNANL